MVEFHQRYYNRAPVLGRALLLGEALLACVLGDVYGDVMTTLTDLQGATILQETRSPFQEEMQDRFINEWGLLANAWGVSPLLGRIHGLLLLVGRPMTAEEVCERLEISRASASVQLNAILGWGLARRMYLRQPATPVRRPAPAGHHR